MKPLLLLLTLTAITLTACRNPEPNTEISTAFDASFFAPNLNDTWTYTLTETKLKPNTPLPAKSTDILTSTQTQTSTYLGPFQLDDTAAHKFALQRENLPPETEIFIINAEQFFAIAYGPSGKPIQKYPHPTPFAYTAMTVGSTWGNPKIGSQEQNFRVVDRESITVPAGTFDAWKITLQLATGKAYQISEYWFAPGHGIVKYVTSTYNATTLLRTLDSELQSFTPGT